VKEFRRLALEGVADELEDPSDQEKGEGVEPQAMEENAGQEKHGRQKDERNPEGVAGAVDGMLMAGGVLGDPLLAGAVA